MGVLSDKNRLLLQFYWRGERFREYIGLADTTANRRDLKKKWRLLRAQIENGTFDYLEWFPNGSKADRFRKPKYEATPLLQDYLRDFHRHRCPYRSDGTLIEGHIPKPSTWRKDGERIEGKLIPSIGSIPLSDLDRPTLRDLQSQLLQSGGSKGQPLSPKTVTNIMGILHCALEQAVEDEVIAKNPCPLLKGGRHLGTAPDPFTKEEIRTILAALPSRWHGFYRVWFATGMRSNEIVALQWRDLDWNLQLISVERGFFARDRIDAGSKTPRRELSLMGDSEVFDIFRREKNRSFASGQPAQIFTDDAGKRLNQESLHKQVFAPTLRKTGIRHRGSYAIRDTFISQALREGADINAVAKFCGTSVKMIERHYWKWIEGSAPEIALSLFSDRDRQNLRQNREAGTRKSPASQGKKKWRRGESNARPLNDSRGFGQVRERLASEPARNQPFRVGKLSESDESQSGPLPGTPAGASVQGQRRRPGRNISFR
jgi:integrase